MAGKKFIIWGSSGHAKVLASLLRSRGDKVVALFDNNPEIHSVIEGVELFIGKEGFEKWAKAASPSEYYGLVAIGGNHGHARMEIQRLFAKYGVNVEAVIHKDASVCDTAKIGKGTHVLANSLIAADVKIGDACIINHSSSVDHECMLGNGVHIAPGATLCGLVEIGDNTMIAAGSVVISRVKIGKNTVIGAGSLVTGDIGDNVVAYGRPAKVIRNNS